MFILNANVVDLCDSLKGQIQLRIHYKIKTFKKQEIIYH